MARPHTLVTCTTQVFNTYSQIFLSAHVDVMKMAGQKASLVPLPLINQVCLGCTQRESITKASNVPKSKEDTNTRAKTIQGETLGKEETLRTRRLIGRRRKISEGSASRKFQDYNILRVSGFKILLVERISWIFKSLRLKNNTLESFL